MAPWIPEHCREHKGTGAEPLRPVLREETTLPDRTTTAQQALDRHHDQYAPLGKVRRVTWPVEDDEPAVAHDFDAHLTAGNIKWGTP